MQRKPRRGRPDVRSGAQVVRHLALWPRRVHRHGGSIKNSFVVREHFEMACSLSLTDATARHLLGLWCYEVAKLSWFEQKCFFASPPKSSFEEALTHFERAEQMEPGFYPKNLLLLANTCAKLGRTTEAKAWLEKCLAAKQVTPEDEETVAEARKLKL